MELFGKKQESIDEMLHQQVAAHCMPGSKKVAVNALGFHQMPHGYALIKQDKGASYYRAKYYWLRYDGRQSVIFHSRWACYRDAAEDANR